MGSNAVEKIIILDIFHQGADCGISEHWCVQYIRVGGTSVEYGYFPTWTEANEFAMSHGYND